MEEIDESNTEVRSGFLIRWLVFRRIFVDALVIFGTLFLVISLGSAVVWVYVFSPNENYLLVKLLTSQFRAVVGLPAAAGMCFLVVWAFEVSRGPVEISLFQGVSFKGAAAPVIFWVFAFVMVGYVLNLNWTKP